MAEPTLSPFRIKNPVLCWIPTIKKQLLPLLAFLLLAGCEAKDVWTPETCNDMLGTTIKQIEEQKKTLGTMLAFMESAQRRGDTAAYEIQKKSYDSVRKEGIGGNLRYIDEQVLTYCNRSDLRPELLSQIDPLRTPTSGTEKAFKSEGMPDIHVTSIHSEFVPYELDGNGGCSGPYLKLTFTVSNSGDDYPRPVDLEEYARRAQKPEKELPFFTLTGEMFLDDALVNRADLEIYEASGAKLKSGGSVKIPVKIKVGNNQKQMHIEGIVRSNALLKTAPNSAPYETDVEIPIWDIYTQSHFATEMKDEDGKKYLGGMAIVTNKGKTPTPGPIRGSFSIYDLESGRYVTGWSDTTEGSVSGEGRIVHKELLTVTLPKKAKVQSTIILLCPDGHSGNLADGDATNNVRELSEQGSPEQAKKTVIDLFGK